MNFVSLVAPYISSMIRHGMTAGAGILAAHGMMVSQQQQASASNWVAAGALGLIGVGWSFIQKRLQKVEVQEALYTPVPATPKPVV